MHTSVPIGDGIFYYAMFLIFFSLLILFFTGCKTTEHGARDYFTRHPNQFADLSAQFFPPGHEYIQGDPILLPGDTVLIAGDSIPCPDKKEGSTSPIKVKCPDSKFVHDTVFRVDTMQVENTAKIEAQANELISLNQQIDQQNATISNMKRQRWYIFIFGMFTPFIAYGAFKLASKLFL